MIFINVSITVTGKNKSIPSKSRDGVGGEKIGSEVVWGMTATAFLCWVGRLIVSSIVKYFDV